MTDNSEIFSFIDIQYAWEAQDKTVFFIPEGQYTQENIQRFNEVKQCAWYLAIATNVYEIRNYESDILTLAFYQHGYYDLLLNCDYRVVPYKLSYLNKEVPDKMTLEDFKKNFVFNERRLKLYNDFVKCITIVKSVTEINCVKVGGSFVEGKELPGDMDLVIYISSKEFEKIKSNEKLYKKYQILTLPHLIKKYGLELDVRVFVEQDINLNEVGLNIQDECLKHLCERGYCASLYTTCYETENKCYIHNRVTVI